MENNLFLPVDGSHHNVALVEIESHEALTWFRHA
jgi:hypothetical protein